MEHDKVYLRVLNDLPFMFEVLRNTEQQADSFAVEMLRLRIIRERETVRLEEDREQREYQERRIEENSNQVAIKERTTDD
jgi:hypothetical protein